MPGQLSDEKPNEVIREVIAPKPKMYSVLIKILQCNKKRVVPLHTCSPIYFSGHSAIAKGIKTSAKKSITHADYNNVLDTSDITMTTARTIRDRKHCIVSSVPSAGLSAYDNKK